MEMLSSKLDFSEPFLCKNWGSRAIYGNPFSTITRLFFKDFDKEDVQNYSDAVKVKNLVLKIKNLEF